MYMYSSVLFCRNYGPTIRIQKVAESKGCNQVLWLFGEDHQVSYNELRDC